MLTLARRRVNQTIQTFRFAQSTDTLPRPTSPHNQKFRPSATRFCARHDLIQILKPELGREKVGMEMQSESLGRVLNQAKTRDKKSQIPPFVPGCWVY